ncbi:hypothetical protein [Anaerorhabdus furcosa]|uniref:Uncharacterized protein n=1 Tax=Anaerorhabdus furcosa TaxID=118967 RepID=A0A1T4K101_9FIRM|nr:hypothetical protein [Anaerorhabdus furcosa]SJZ36058.1 hypothetical protein SAMN02745191_0221 [Anaerorhabdus furcosa]
MLFWLFGIIISVIGLALTLPFWILSVVMWIPLIILIVVGAVVIAIVGFALKLIFW